MADIYMRILISANSTASSVIRGIAADAAAAKASLALMAGAGVLVVGAALAFSVVQAANFQQGLNRLVTGAGDVTDNMTKMGQAILGISVDTGVMTGPLLQAMYQIISAGQRGAQAENTLAVAARGSVVEQANVVDVAKALTTAMTDYGTAQFNATQFMNGYTRATQLGKLTLEQLSVSMGPILPLAKNLGIGFADVAAAMSTMTNAGIPADRAATSLRFLFQSLENPTHKASAAMKQFGLDSVGLANELKVSLPGALQMVYDAAKKAGPEGSVPFNRAVSDMIGGQRSLSAYLALTGTHMATFKSNSLAITAAMTGSKTAVLGWSVAQGNFNVQLDRAKAALLAVAINIGTLLLPVLTRIVIAITPIILAFGTWITQMMQNKTALAIFAGIMAGLGAIILMVVVPAFITWAGAALGASIAMFGLEAPILLIAAIVAVVVIGVILAIQHWGQITQWLGDVWKTVSTTIGSWMSWLGTLTHTVLGAIGSFVGGVFSAMGTFIHDRLVWIQNTVVAIWAAIKAAFGAALGFIGNLVGTVFSAIGSWFTWLYNHNYYIKALCDFIVKAFTDLKAFIGTVFNAIGTIITTVLTFIKNTVGSIFSAIGTFIHDRLVWIQNTVGAIFNAIGTFVRGVLSALASFIGGIFSWIGSVMGSKSNDAKNVVGNAFSALGNAVQNILGGLGRWIGSFFSNIVGMAWSWGANLIGNLIGGIGSMIGNLFSSLGNVAQGIKNFLGFHSPPLMGPARDADKWMPNMMTMFAKGITSGQPAMAGALHPVAAGLRPTVAGGASGHTFNNTFVFHVQQLDPREADRVAVLMADKLRAQMGNI